MNSFYLLSIVNQRFLFVLLFLLSTPVLAQSNFSFGWSNESACSIFDSEGIFPIEELDDLPCFQVCEGTESVYWIDGVSDEAIIIRWSVIGGDIIGQPTNESIVVLWGTPSPTGVISVEVETEEGTIFEFEFCVKILEAPRASFKIQPESDELAYCINQMVYFINTSIPNPGGQITSYYWEFGDGNTSVQFEPAHVYNSPGVYEVKLSVRNECYCIDTYKLDIRVLDRGAPIEIVCPTVTCENAIETYTAISECEFQWSVEGGTIINNTENNSEVEVQWDNVDETGFGWVMLEMMNCYGCPAPSVVKVPVILEEGHIKGEETICIGKQYRYSLPQWPATEFNWILLDASGVDYSQYLVNVDQRNEIII